MRRDASSNASSDFVVNGENEVLVAACSTVLNGVIAATFETAV